LELYTFDPNEDGYPSFAALFEPNEQVAPVPYLALLNLQRWNWLQVLAAVRIVRQSIAMSPNVETEVAALFRKNAWRSHLVGAVAVSMGIDSPLTLSALWLAFDTGTWVSPQLAVAAFLSDRAFAEQARTRIVDTFTEHTSKSLAALAALCQRLPAMIDWLDAALADEARNKAVIDSWDRGDQIAVDWLENIGTALKGAQ
jgi:hypothetical protein